jgi:hypothetical protein
MLLWRRATTTTTAFYQALFSVDPCCRFHSQEERVKASMCDRHLVLCACLGLLREVSQTQTAVEARYNNYDRVLSSSFFSGSGLLPFSQCVGQHCVMYVQ